MAKGVLHTAAMARLGNKVKKMEGGVPSLKTNPEGTKKGEQVQADPIVYTVPAC